jgi:hypothetical protein
VVEAERKDRELRLIDSTSAILQNKSQGPVAILETFLLADMENAEKQIFRNIRCVGGPTNVRDWFVDDPKEIEKDDILYNLVQEQFAIVQNRMR